MEPRSFAFQANDNKTIHAYQWETPFPLKGVVQIFHGMSEHSKRYHDFALKLKDQGFSVFAHDHRGHGQTAGSIENLGHFADEGGWEIAVDDCYQLTTLIRSKISNNVPLFLLGHSMGSFLARRYIQKYNQEDLNGVILMGTGSDQGWLSAFGILLARILTILKGKKAKSPLLNQLTFGKFNQAFHPPRTAFDWLTRNSQVVDQYMADPYCGAPPTNQFFCDLLRGIKDLEKPDLLTQIPRHLPILLLSGGKDPVGDHARGVKLTYQAFQQMGMKDVQMKIYPEARHELLNELNQSEVIEDILSWLHMKSE